MLTPIEEPRKGWLEAFNTQADKHSDQMIIDVPIDFDKEEWTW